VVRQPGERVQDVLDRVGGLIGAEQDVGLVVVEHEGGRAGCVGLAADVEGGDRRAVVAAVERPAD
jgi:hypothetical protein